MVTTATGFFLPFGIAGKAELSPTLKLQEHMLISI